MLCKCYWIVLCNMHVTAFCIGALFFFWTWCIFYGFWDICIQIYLDHNLDCSGSSDVTAHVTICYPSAISYRCSIITKSVSPAIFKIMGPKHIGAWPWPFRVTWRYRSCDHSIRRMPFPIDAPLEPSLSSTFSRYIWPKICACAHTQKETKKETYIASNLKFCPMQCFASDTQ